ncbi:MAG: hypothetical protein KMY53_08415 [Desulfarculus sp.]|nr:hypothetical protein [Pseudomonadota bacterium]MBV1716096.1 hypothetical protein [Desulfarculus sp.]MBU4574819.1 hypothetical protein [Pseudomonadota bacterium]MBU4596388.1 hypothetical protein [Pseudomonadota bacterium]MBV1738171.1 hypothetical protein [Desulfarculus sp.]
METKLLRLMQQKKFISAVNVLKEELIAGNILDPRFDSVWAQLADKILAAANPERNLYYELSYWTDWFHFFITVIEPKWGHAHKGHIYFRLGFAHTQDDEKIAVKNFEFAQSENEIFATNYLGYQGDQVLEYCRGQSSYVALCLLEKMDLLDFADNLERKTFISRIFSEAFDRAIQHLFPDPKQVGESLTTIIKSPKFNKHATIIFNELLTVANMSLTYATISSLGSLLETILLDAIPESKMIDKKGNKIDKMTLGILFNLADRNSVFPDDLIKASCRLVSFLRNRIHSKNTLDAKYPLTPRASHTLMILLELSLIAWAKTLANNNRA